MRDPDSSSILPSHARLPRLETLAPGGGGAAATAVAAALWRTRAPPLAGSRPREQAAAALLAGAEQTALLAAAAHESNYFLSDPDGLGRAWPPPVVTRLLWGAPPLGVQGHGGRGARCGWVLRRQQDQRGRHDLCVAASDSPSSSASTLACKGPSLPVEAFSEERVTCLHPLPAAPRPHEMSLHWCSMYERCRKPDWDEANFEFNCER